MRPKALGIFGDAFEDIVIYITCGEDGETGINRNKGGVLKDIVVIGFYSLNLEVQKIYKFWTWRLGG